MTKSRFSVAECWLAVLCFSAFVSLASFYALTTPLFEKPDEPQHYAVIQYIANGNGLPIIAGSEQALWKQEGSLQPPLFYMLAALVTFWIDTRDFSQWVQENPHAVYDTTANLRNNHNFFVHGRLETWPPHGVGLAVYLSRGLAILFGGLTVIFTYFMARVLRSQSQWTAVLAAALCGLSPQFLFISSSASNDSLVACLSAATLFYLLACVEQGFSFRNGLVLGVLVGLSGLAKNSGFFLLPLVYVVIALQSWRVRAFTHGLKISTAIGLSFALVTGWWFARNLILYGEFSGVRAAVDLVGARTTPMNFAAWVAEAAQVFRSYWGHFGWNNLPMDDGVYATLASLQIAAVLGLSGWSWQQRKSVAVSRSFVLLGWTLLIIVALWQWMQIMIAPHGRLLFPAMPAIATLTALGLVQLANVLPRLVPVVLGFVVVGLMLLALLVPSRYIVPAYQLSSRLRAQDVPATYTRTNIVFDGQFALLAYQVPALPLQANQTYPVTLCWQAVARMDADYSLFVHLVGADGRMLEQLDTMPGLGHFPTTLWNVGEVLCETYPLRLTPRITSSDEAQIAVGVYQHTTNRRLLAVNAQGEQLGEQVRLAQMPIIRTRAADSPVAYPVRARFGESITLLGYDTPRFMWQAGETMPLTLYWQTSAPLSEDYVVFIHVLDARQKGWTQAQAEPQQGQAPTSTWTPNALVEDTYLLKLPDDAPSGAYEVRVGMVRPKGPRLRINMNDIRLDDPTRLLVTYIRVGTTSH